MKNIEALTVLQKEDTEKNKTKTQASRILEICEDLQLFHDTSHEPFVTARVEHGELTMPVKSSSFREYIRHTYYSRFQSVPGSQGLQDAIELLAAKAIFVGQQMPVHVRYAEHSTRIYVDLANARNEVVEICANGWRVLPEAPVKFRRPKGMLPMPSPKQVDGCQAIEAFRDFLNLLPPDPQSDDFKLVVAFMLGAMNPNGPFPVLIPFGEQGSSKSSMTKMIRSIVDPHDSPLRSPPRNIEDMVLGARNNWLPAFDNVSHLPEWESDTICRIATGGALARRTLYENDEETIFKVKRPQIYNGIDEFVNRSDLSDRAIFIYSPVIPPERRRSEAELFSNFETWKPSILGTLFNAVAAALRNRDSTLLKRAPRMADFAIWVSAAERALGWSSGTFVDLYFKNQAQVNRTILDNSTIVPALSFVATNGFEGTATELLQKINDWRLRPESPYVDPKTWPHTAKNISDRLRRIAPNLRMDGYEVEFFQTPGRDSQKIITLRKTPRKCDASDAPSRSIAERVERVAGVAEIQQNSAKTSPAYVTTEEIQ